MRIYYQFDQVVPLGPTVVAISGYDGVHRGHRRLIARAAELAAQRGATLVAALVWPGSNAQGNEQEQRRLTTLAERLDRLKRLSLVDVALILPSSPPPAPYLGQISAWSDVHALLALSDDADDSDGTTWLLDVARERGMAVELVAAEDSGVQVTANAIMELVEVGAVEDAASRLGHSFTLYGEVLTGDRRGRLLGFPTANLRPAAYGVLPSNGVYAVRVRLPGESVASHSGVVNVGVRPTFGGDPIRLVEVHLLDVALDMYGMSIAVEFVRRLRAEQRFDGIDALKTQITADAQQARASLQREVPAAGNE